MDTSSVFRRTRFVFLCSRLLNTPFWVIFNILFILLYKEVHATPLQVTLTIMLKPAAALFSPYWSCWTEKKPSKLISNVLWANILKYIPFLGFPWYGNNWFFVLSFGIYMILLRGANPAWMEILKHNIKGKSREEIIAHGTTIYYLGNAFFPLLFGLILDEYISYWRWVFFATALLGIASSFLIKLIPFNPSYFNQDQKEDFSSFTQAFIKPWKSSWHLLKTRPDFKNFQIGFTLCATALMMIHPILPYFFTEVLDLSYTKIMFILSICKAIGVFFSSSTWVYLFGKRNIFSFCSLVTLFASSWVVLLFCGYFFSLAPYVAYVLYGIMQGGSELSWHMSGLYFAKQNDSISFTNTNIYSVGVRGCIAPLMGSLIFSFSHCIVVMIISFLLCLIAAKQMKNYSMQNYAHVVK